MVQWNLSEIGERLGQSLATFLAGINKILILNDDGDLGTADYLDTTSAINRVWMQDNSGFILATYEEALELILGEALEDGSTLGVTATALIQRTVAEQVANLLPSLIGSFAFPVYADSFRARDTNGATSGEDETATNKIMRFWYAFDKDADEHVNFPFYFPPAYSGGDITAIFLWSHPAATVFDHAWAIRIGSIGNNETMDVTLGTPVVVSDTGGTTGRLYISAATAAITPSGTPAGGELAWVEVFRDVSADTGDTDGNLHAVVLMVPMSNIKDA